MPDIKPEIREYLDCFIQCDSQVRAAVNGIFALDWNIIVKVGEAKGIEINNKFFRMLKAFESAFLKEVNTNE